MAFAVANAPFVATDVGAAGIATTITSAPTAGNLVVLSFATAPGIQITSITQTGVVWNAATSLRNNGTGVSCEIWMGLAGAGASANITIATTRAAASTICLVHQEFSGFAGQPTLDKTKAANGTTTALSSGSTATTTQANEIWFSAFGMLSASGDEICSTWTNSYQNGANVQSGVNFSLSTCYIFKGATGTTFVQGTATGSAINNSSVSTVTLYDLVSGGGHALLSACGAG